MYFTESTPNPPCYSWGKSPQQAKLPWLFVRPLPCTPPPFCWLIFEGLGPWLIHRSFLGPERSENSESASDLLCEPSPFNTVFFHTLSWKNRTLCLLGWPSSGISTPLACVSHAQGTQKWECLVLKQRDISFSLLLTVLLKVLEPPPQPGHGTLHFVIQRQCFSSLPPERSRGVSEEVSQHWEEGVLGTGSQFHSS